ncbi:hypothetical protein [Sphaerisporangium sp. NPDC051011]|uniref:hypothetical protein n=1 Tax=Sphaerisporangium sp. NPDC051011 TaxID=3155792 RepID=UPI0033CBAFCC
MPAELSPEEAGHVIGGQANIWTEYMDSGRVVDYFAFPAWRRWRKSCGLRPACVTCPVSASAWELTCCVWKPWGSSSAGRRARNRGNNGPGSPDAPGPRRNATPTSPASPAGHTRQQARLYGR